MTQNYTNIVSSDMVGESLEPIKDRDQANKTNFMGTSFPEVTANDVGMPVIIIKTENDIEYRQLWRLVGFSDNQPQWQLERDLLRGLVYSDTSSDKVISTYQETNALLTSLANQVATGTQENANKVPYLSDTNTFSLTAITALARNFLAAVDAAAARGVLGLGSLSTKSSVTSSDIAANGVALSNLATGTYGKCISYAANGQPTLVSLPAGVPVGSVLMFSSTVLPDNSWIFCYGQQLSKADYPELWAYASASNNITSNLTDWQTNRLGSFYEESSTVFRVPDLRNYFIRPWDGPEGPTRTVGNIQGDAIRNITGTFVGGRNYGPTEGAFLALGRATGVGSGSSFDQNWNYFDASRVVPVANENRPKNIVLPFIMKAKTLAS